MMGHRHVTTTEYIPHGEPLGSLYRFGGVGLAAMAPKDSDLQRIHLEATTGIEPV